MGGEDAWLLGNGSVHYQVKFVKLLNSFGQGNFTFVREKSGNFKNLLFVAIILIY